MPRPSLLAPACLTLLVLLAACSEKETAPAPPPPVPSTDEVARQVKVLRKGEVEARREAAAELGVLGPEAASAVIALRGALLDLDPLVKAQAAQALQA